MKASHLDAEQRYSRLRATALRVAEAQIPTALGITLHAIDSAALAAFHEWVANGERLVDWDWAGGYHDFAYRHPKRFEMAMRQNNRLISLALGRPTYHGCGLRLDFVEARHDGRTTKIFPIVMLALTVYANAIGADEIRVVNPINDSVRKYYEEAGLTYVPKGHFLFKKIYR